MHQVLFNAGLFSAMELGPGFKVPDPNAHDFQVTARLWNKSGC